MKNEWFMLIILQYKNINKTHNPKKYTYTVTGMYFDRNLPSLVMNYSKLFQNLYDNIVNA